MIPNMKSPFRRMKNSLSKSASSLVLADEKLGRFSGDVPDAQSLGDMFEQLLDELALPEAKRVAMRAMPDEKKLMMVKQQQANEEHKMDSNRNLSELSNTSFKQPGSYIEGIVDHDTPLVEHVKNLRSLEVALRTLPISWVTEFLEMNGLAVLLQIMKQTSVKSGLEVKERELQHQLIRCIKNLMNTGRGLMAVMDSADSVGTVALGLDCNSLKMKATILEMLGAVCLVPGRGQELVLGALNFYQRCKREKHRFQDILVDLNMDDIDYNITCLAFINAIVNTPEDAEVRVSLRLELLALGLTDFITCLRQWNNTDLNKHLNTFENEARSDFEDVAPPTVDVASLDLNDPDDLFSAIKGCITEPDSYQWLLRATQQLFTLSCGHPQRRGEYWRLVSELVAEIIFQRNQVCFDFHRLKIRLDSLVEGFAATKEQRVPVKDDSESLRQQIVQLKESIKSRRPTVTREAAAPQVDSGEIERLTKSLNVESEARVKLQADFEALQHKIGIKEKELQEIKQQQLQVLRTDANSTAPGTKTMASSRSLSSALLNKLAAETPKAEVPERTVNLAPQTIEAPHQLPVAVTAPPPPPPGPPPPGPPPPSGPGKASKPASNRKQASVKMKQLQWKKLPPAVIQNTVWKNVDDAKVESLIDFYELEAIFGLVEKEAAPTGTASQDDLKKVAVITLLDSKKAYNLMIMLSRVKTPFPELREAILRLSDDVVPESFLRQLLGYIPTAEEEAVLSENLDNFANLGKAEQFYIEMMKISYYEKRLKGWQLKRKLYERMEEVKPSIDVLLAAAKEVKSSSSLQRVLELVLLIGNFMNGSTFRGNASGFQLELLTQLGDIRTSRKGNFLQYLNTLIDQKFPEAANFIGELSNVEKASKVSLPAVSQEMAELGASIRELEQDLPLYSATADSNDLFHATMTEFVAQTLPVFEALEKKKAEADKAFSSAVAFFGEDPKSQPETFFGLFWTFMQQFERARKENEAEMAKMAKGTIKDSRSVVGTTRNRSGTTATPPKEGRGVMDELISSLKTGEGILHKTQVRNANRMSKMLSKDDANTANLMAQLQTMDK